MASALPVKPTVVWQPLGVEGPLSGVQVHRDRLAYVQPSLIVLTALDITGFVITEVLDGFRAKALSVIPRVPLVAPDEFPPSEARPVIDHLRAGIVFAISLLSHDDRCAFILLPVVASDRAAGGWVRVDDIATCTIISHVSICAIPIRNTAFFSKRCHRQQRCGRRKGRQQQENG